MNMSRISPVEAARRIWRERYGDARVLFLAGSVLRGEATPASDLDIVVAYERLPHARREAFVFEGWPVEAFVHDPETLAHFFETERRRGLPALMSMLIEGVEIPESCEFSAGLKRAASRMFEAGPELGGLVRTFTVGGERLEAFYHHIFTTDTTIVRLINDLGLGDQLTWRDSKVGFYNGGKLYNFVTPMDLLKFKPLPLIDRVRLGLVSVSDRPLDWFATSSTLFGRSRGHARGSGDGDEVRVAATMVSADALAEP